MTADPVITGVVSGPPKAASRPKASHLDGGFRMHMPNKYIREKKRVSQWLVVLTQGHSRPVFPAGTPVHLEIGFYVGGVNAPGACTVFRVSTVFHPADNAFADRPNSAPCGTRPDLDNYIKTFMDAANGILWADDGQVAKVTASKWKIEDDPAVVKARKAEREAERMRRRRPG